MGIDTNQFIQYFDKYFGKMKQAAQRFRNLEDIFLAAITLVLKSFFTFVRHESLERSASFFSLIFSKKYSEDGLVFFT